MLEPVALLLRRPNKSGRGPRYNLERSTRFLGYSARLFPLIKSGVQLAPPPVSAIE